MNLLGKSFSTAIFLLSAAFMVLALAVNASHRNWREQVLGDGKGVPGLKKQIEDIASINRQLQNSEQDALADLDRERAARRTALAALQTQLDNLNQKLQATEKEAGDLRAANSVLAQTDETRAKQLEEIIAQNATLREQIRAEQNERDELFSQVLVMTDQVNKLRGFKNALQDRNEQLLAQVARFTEVMESKAIDINEPLDGAPPERNGNILQIDRPTSLVLVSIGYDEGLREGHFLEVTRDGRYVGRLKVRKTETDRAVAEILADYSDGILQEGDRVDTTLD
jgi:Skp family chaperone for outer membrane proteins